MVAVLLTLCGAVGNSKGVWMLFVWIREPHRFEAALLMVSCCRL